MLQFMGGRRVVYVIFGPETYRRDIEVEKLTRECAITKVETFSADCQDVLESASFFGKNTVILKVKSLGADESILKYLKKHIPRDNDFIIMAETVNERTKLFSLLKKEAKLIECKKLMQKELVNYCLKAFKQYDCQITLSAMEALINRSGYLVDNEITLYKINIFIKQLAYHTCEIAISDVELLIKKHSSEDSRRLLALLVSGQKEELMSLAAELLETENPIMIYGSILRNLRIAYKAVLFSDKEEKELGKLLGLNQYQMRNIAPVRKIPQQSINELISLVQNATNEIKNGLMPAKASFIQTIGMMVSLLQQ